ncbi:MAG: hypothetical protein ACH6QQ_00405 [Candidatus Carsonella ruddii]
MKIIIKKTNKNYYIYLINNNKNICFIKNNKKNFDILFEKIKKIFFFFKKKIFYFIKYKGFCRKIIDFINNFNGEQIN